MNLTTIKYLDYEKDLPQEHNHVVGQIENDSIVVYQAFNSAIAKYAVENQKFGGSSYSMTRMTWIKPNFLWMMYRSGWGIKENQERTLAIKLKLDDFYALLEKGVYTSYQERVYGTHENWRKELNESAIRIQWDPDHDPNGEKHTRKAVQIGFKGDVLSQFNEEMIESITDISEFVESQRLHVISNFKELLVMNESKIELPIKLNEKYDIRT